MVLGQVPLLLGLQVHSRKKGSLSLRAFSGTASIPGICRPFLGIPSETLLHAGEEEEEGFIFLLHLSVHLGDPCKGVLSTQQT